MGLANFKFSPLPTPPTQYDHLYVLQLVRSIETYFRHLDSGAALAADRFLGSGSGLTIPFLQVSLTQSQDITTTGEPVPLLIDWDTSLRGEVGEVTPTTVEIGRAGIYLLRMELTLTNSGSSPEDVDILLLRGATKVDGVGTTLTIQDNGQETFKDEVYVPFEVGMLLTLAVETSSLGIAVASGRIQMRQISAV